MSASAIRPYGQLLGTLFPDMAARLAVRLATTPRRRRALAAVPPGAEPVTLRFGLAGLRWGDRGPRVLALHGWDGQAAQFAPLAERLCAAGFQVIALDGPAHGRSPGRRADPVAFSDALLESAPELGPLHGVIGHSMGGGAVMHALARGLCAERAVVVAAPSAYVDVLERIARSIGLPAAATARFVAWMERRTGVPAAQLDIAHFARDSGTPVLVVHDRGDRVVPFADGRRIAEIAGAALHATDGLGHARLLRDAGVAQTVLRFLRR
ncbi:alpha/beta hydrolase [Chiayiivirga flava]|uniref:Alpha-beta hydrolase superfamily lysophospholipase n=1 Tax=Chiayiivirga flava TaxID=659595 RepID=A0A7W8D287_9GAMM|nr:alpha/beta fold hydrolase [Chiayiivirga flava]MBB5206576.1 alpha-beta hydrolase superfamily lysophospholipase [Chiayiivirga flava]